MKPIIGVMPLWDDYKESIWMLPGYMEGVKQAGGLPIILPFSTDELEIEQMVNVCDGFLFTGGHDVNPDLYNEKPLGDLVECCEMRDVMEAIYLEKAMEAKKSILGICRGIQIINVLLGGTLYQDIPIQYPTKVEHHQRAPYDEAAHKVRINRDTPLFACIGVESFMVNSYHHQAVNKLGEGLEIMAVAEDGLVEAVYMPDYPFLWALQWHPEFIWEKDEKNKKIFDEFVNSLK